MKPTKPAAHPVKVRQIIGGDPFPFLFIAAIFILAMFLMTRDKKQDRIDHLQQSVDKLQHTIDSINYEKR